MSKSWTPQDWKVFAVTMGGGTYSIWIEGPPSKRIATGIAGKELARFIVRACCAHDDLVTACKAAYTKLTAIHDSGYGEHKENLLPTMLRTAIKKGE